GGGQAGLTERSEPRRELLAERGLVRDHQRATSELGRGVELRPASRERAGECGGGETFRLCVTARRSDGETRAQRCELRARTAASRDRRMPHQPLEREPGNGAGRRP